MENEKRLIYADDARREILREAPELAYCIDRVKSVDSVKFGHWVSDKKTGLCYCSECLVIGSPQWKRCPVCEAKMEGGSDNGQA